MRVCKRIFLISLLSTFAFTVFSQKSDGISLELSQGSLIKHSPKLIDTQQPLYSVKLSLSKWGNGSAYWHKRHHYPRYGLSLKFNTFGLPDVYGNIASLFPWVQWTMLSYKGTSLSGFLETGVGYAFQPYNRATNPLNQGLGSKFNNYTSIGLTLHQRVYKNNYIFAGASLSHHSNGSAKKPNLGFNQFFISGGLYVSMSMDKVLEETHLNAMSRWGISYAWSLGKKSHYNFSGPQFSVYFQTIEFSYRLNEVGTLTLGFDREWHEFDEFFKISSNLEEDHATNRKGNSRNSIVTGYEIGFGQVALQIMIGAYFEPHASPFIRFPIYNRLKCKYYFRDPVINQISMYGVVSLKSHLGVAEYISAGIGASLFTKKQIP